MADIEGVVLPPDGLGEAPPPPPEPTYVTRKTLSNEDLDAIQAALEKMSEAGISPFDPRYRALEKICDHQEALEDATKTRQAALIKAQVLSFRHLSRNVSLPAGLLNAVSTHRDEDSVQLPKHKVDYSMEGQRKRRDRDEDDKRLFSKINYRLIELAHLPPLPDVLKHKATLEEKQLKMVPLQRKLRSEMVEEYYAPRLWAAASRADFRRPLPPSPAGEGGMSTGFMPRNSDKNARRQAKHQEYLESIIAQGVKFRTFHKNRIEQRIRTTKVLTTWLEQAPLRQREAEMRKQRELIKALKEDNEEEYRRIVSESKNKRLETLLSQTDEALANIGQHLQQQKNQISGMPTAPLGKNEEFDAEKGIKDFLNAHSVKETVNEQPTLIKGGQLKAYQLDGLQWLVSLYNNQLNGILADEMGLGKTLQSLALIAYLIEHKHNNGPYLIVVPLSTVSNWSNEMNRWTPTIEKVVYKGSILARRDLFTSVVQPRKFKVCITTYEYVMKDKANLAKIKWEYIIVDEGHRMKNKESRLSSLLSTVYKSTFRLLLTGTPLQNNLPELWSLLNFLLPKIFNSSDNFDAWFNAPFSAHGERLTLNEEEKIIIVKRLHKVLRPFLLRRLKSEVESQLPEKQESLIKVELSSLQRTLYTQMKEQLVSNRARTTNKNMKNTLMQLRKVCNHPYLFEEVDTEETDEKIVRSSGKFELLDRILPKLRAANHRVLIFSQFTAVLTIMEDYFLYRGYTYLRLDGSTKASDRGVMLTKFNAPDSPYFVFILSTRAGGLGLNLQSADTVIIFDSDWNPHMDLQAQDRAHRIGQKSEVRVLRLVSVNTIEEHILERANFKLNMDAMVIEAGNFGGGEVAADDKNEVLEALMKEDAAEVTAEDLPDDEEINQMLSRGKDDLKLFAEMDRARVTKEEKAWKAQGKKLPVQRLMGPDELPEWLTREPSSDEEDDPANFGRGRRKTSEVNYDDGLTENQWLRRVEKGMSNTEIERDAKAKRERKRARDTSEDGESGDGTEDEPPVKKRRGRPPRNAQAEADGDEDDDGGGEVMHGGGMSVKKMNKRFRKILKEVISIEDDEGRIRSELFMELPEQEAYPDYYKKIGDPISLDQISEKIEERAYHTVEQFDEDMLRVFGNALEYNEDGSEVYKDAQNLQDAYFRIKEEILSAREKKDKEKDKDKKKGKDKKDKEKLKIIAPISILKRKKSDMPPEPDANDGQPPVKRKRGRPPKNRPAPPPVETPKVEEAKDGEAKEGEAAAEGAEGADGDRPPLKVRFKVSGGDGAVKNEGEVAAEGGEAAAEAEAAPEAATGEAMDTTTPVAGDVPAVEEAAPAEAAPEPEPEAAEAQPVGDAAMTEAAPAGEPAAADDSAQPMEL